MTHKKLDKDFTIGILGAGAMGRGIAQVAALGGLSVLITDGQAGVAIEARAFIEKMLGRAVEKQRLEQADATKAMALISVGDGMDCLKNCDLVIEAIIEDIDIKKKTFKELEDLCGPDTILASNTSALPVSVIGSDCEHRSRIAGMHFFNPVPLMKLVEIIHTPFTDPAVSELLSQVAERMGRTPVRVKDNPGFLAGNTGRAYFTEALRIHQEQIAPPADIDRIARDAGGFRMGPFELIDLIGMDVNYPATLSMFHDFFSEPRYRPSPDYRLLFESKTLGRKTGQGFYRYDDDKKPMIDDEPDAPKTLPQKVWLWGHKKAALKQLTDLAKQAGVSVETGKKPSKGSLALIAPLADDATTTALSLGIDHTHTVAVDTVFGWDSRRTVMAPPGADRNTIEQALSLLASDGVKVTRVNDSPGFVMPRLQAVMTNLSCENCQLGVATPEDLDTAMKLGFNYPEGPLDAGDRLGGGLILNIIETLQAFYGDDRYRASPWLKRRAQLGVSLKTPERN
jgi:3-hydroxybutyryl-CoA dehydrogenase